jgi:hypothetical protein
MLWWWYSNWNTLEHTLMSLMVVNLSHKMIYFCGCVLDTTRQSFLILFYEILWMLFNGNQSVTYLEGLFGRIFALRKSSGELYDVVYLFKWPLDLIHQALLCNSVTVNIELPCSDSSVKSLTIVWQNSKTLVFV